MLKNTMKPPNNRYDMDIGDNYFEKDISEKLCEECASVRLRAVHAVPFF